MSKGTIVLAIQVVSVVFTAFGEFLHEVAPPVEAGRRFASGMSCFCALIVLLLIRATRPNRRYLRRYRRRLTVLGVWLGIISVASGALYARRLWVLTAPYPPKPRTKYRFVVGTERTHFARRTFLPDADPSEMIARVGGPYPLDQRKTIWRSIPIQYVRGKLVQSYMLFAVTLAGSVLCLAEAAACAEREQRASE